MLFPIGYHVKKMPNVVRFMTFAHFVEQGPQGVAKKGPIPKKAVWSPKVPKKGAKGLKK